MKSLIKPSNFIKDDAALIETICSYYAQISSDFSGEISEFLLQNTVFSGQLLKCFSLKFNPETLNKNLSDECVIDLRSKEKNVKFTEILCDIIDAIVRTNFYNKEIDCISFKLKPLEIKNLPKPVPFAEIFVYNNEFEGVHIRGDAIARGGFRISDRSDYRTENLGLVKAQILKNVIITPSGAKACLYIKEKNIAQELQLDFTKSCYVKFVNALLELTDNEIDGVKKEIAIKYDNFDKYLVVAADKGTASFSDIANIVSAENNFWLKDAFASGGSNGYSHKDLGITSRGAYMCSRNSFYELGINAEKDEIMAVGIGDMSGDVFGNGMLLFPKLKLVFAFNHKHLFIDPNPDIEKSKSARVKMFANPKLQWSDYDKSTISLGGGVFDRFGGDVVLNDQIRNLFGIDENAASINPEVLINKALKLNVDLIWNGGIGTFVKAEQESHQEAKDKFNDSIRVNGNEINAKVFAEGGNVGVTQKGRIEASFKGVKINMDSIDNSAGVACSDREVNLKIALNNSKNLTSEDYKSLILSMKNSVVDLVLEENYLQSKLIGIASKRLAEDSKGYIELIANLEKNGILDTKVQQVKSPEELAELEKSGANSASRSDICVLLSHTKLYLKQKLISMNDLLSDKYFEKNILFSYFPKEMTCGRFDGEILNHPIKSNIVAAGIVNRFVDFFGLANISYCMKLNLDLSKIIKAYYVANEIFGAEKLFDIAYSQDFIVSFDQQAAAVKKLQDALLVTILMINANVDLDRSLDSVILSLNSSFGNLKSIIKGDCCSDVKSSCCFDAEYTAGLKLMKLSPMIFTGLKLINSGNVANFADSWHVVKAYGKWLKVLMSEVYKAMISGWSESNAVVLKSLSNAVNAMFMICSKADSSDTVAKKSLELFEVKYDDIVKKNDHCIQIMNEICRL
jgi:glutamate dehydrogenase